jgi:hypothetical protein
MGQLYLAANGVEPTVASRVAVATGTAIKTLLQIATPSTAEIKIIEWGISFDGNAAAVPGIVELIQTDVAATSGSSLTPTLWENPNGVPSLCVGGTGATCFSPSAEGTITVVRTLGVGHIMGTNQYEKQFPLGREPRIPISKFLRIRVKFAATVNAICYIIWDE